MQESEFDRFADEYRQLHARNIRASGEGPEFFAEYKVSDVALALGPTASSAELKILDFGAGIGTSVPYFRKHLPRARLTCIDVSRKSLEIGRQRFGPEAEFVHFDGQSIPLDDATFDVAFAACVFHHIPQPEHAGLISDLARVLRRPGHIFIFEHNPRNPLTVRTVKECAFDENAVLIGARQLAGQLRDAAGAPVDIRYRIFFPGFARSLRPLERWLTWLPIGAQYCLHARVA